MRRILTFALLGSIIVGYPQSAVLAQSGTVTYVWPSGSNVASVTVNYDTHTVTWNYTDGTQFSQTEPNVGFTAFTRWLKQQRLPTE